MFDTLPTKGNLAAIKKSLKLAGMGYELLDKKRAALLSELVALSEKARDLKSRITKAFDEAYGSLAQANISLGSDLTSELAEACPVDSGLQIRFRGTMGTALPIVRREKFTPQPYFGFNITNSRIDKAYLSFLKIKELIQELAETENGLCRLAFAVKKTSRRENALKNIVIPRSTLLVKSISERLEEGEREELARLKVIKRAKEQTTLDIF